MVRDLHGEPFIVRKQDKALYHVWGMFTSPLLLALLVTAEQVARAAGISAKDVRKRMLPIIVQTLANYASLGPAQSFSGPLVRGDAATVGEHLAVLGRVPAAREAYIALARSALLGLPVRNRKKLEELLKRA
jgi:predicted short-subunit dehydrogenase-like oxidoreductase (DUF2520 family)